MTDPRHDTLARLLVQHSTRLKPDEHVLIEAFDAPESMVVSLVRVFRSM